MGRRGLPGRGQDGPRRTHLELLLGHEVLHAPDDLDGGPMVLPQPARRTEKRCQWPPRDGAGRLPRVPCGRGTSRDRTLDLLAWRPSWPCPGVVEAEGPAQQALISRVVPEGPLPCLSLRSGVGVGVPGSQWLSPNSQQSDKASALGLRGPSVMGGVQADPAQGPFQPERPAAPQTGVPLEDRGAAGRLAEDMGTTKTTPSLRCICIEERLEGSPCPQTQRGYCFWC